MKKQPGHRKYNVSEADLYVTCMEALRAAHRDLDFRRQVWCLQVLAQVRDDLHNPPRVRTHAARGRVLKRRVMESNGRHLRVLSGSETDLTTHNIVLQSMSQRLQRT